MDTILQIHIELSVLVSLWIPIAVYTACLLLPTPPQPCKTFTTNFLCCARFALAFLLLPLEAVLHILHLLRVLLASDLLPMPLPLQLLRVSCVFFTVYAVLFLGAIKIPTTCMRP